MTTPDPIVVTEEMRQAVYAADCKALGHIFDVSVGYGPQSDPDVISSRPDEFGEDTMLPHIICRRCPRVWIVMADQPSNSYEEAEQKVVERMKSSDSFTKLVKDRQEHRQNLHDLRTAAAAAEAEMIAHGHGHGHGH